VSRKSEISPSDKAALSARSVRILGLPEKTQEGLLQQALEKITTVKKLEVFNDKAEALAELSSPAVSLPWILPFYVKLKSLIS
jgi:hypothetical protein